MKKAPGQCISGFTLIEIMIVIAIIAILMTVTMRFGSKRIDDLGDQSGKEQFVAAYDKLYSQVTTSNYHEGIRYDMLHIMLSSGANPLAYAFDSGIVQTISISTPLAISGMQQDAANVDAITLDIQPYILGCTLTSNNGNEITSGSAVNFSLVVKGQKAYCFTLHSDTCKLIEKTCE